MGVDELLDRQAGVITRQQALDANLTVNDIRRKCRRREWVQLCPGIYVNHTGELTWLQRAWCAVLATWPSALHSHSALRAADGPGRRGDEDEQIHVAIDRKRTLTSLPGVVLHRVSELDRKAMWNTSPPRFRIEEAVIDLASCAADEFAAIKVLSDAVQTRRTTPDRLIVALSQRRRIERRTFIANVLHDIKSGAWSVLEHGYLTRVERAHGLPEAVRQAKAAARGRIYRDVLYEEQGLIVELDGKLFHDSAAARDRDFDRDLAAQADRLRTVRLSWGQVFGRPCETAAWIGQLLLDQGWTGQLKRCPDCPSN